MGTQKPETPHPRAHILGRSFHLARGEEAMGVMIHEGRLVRMPTTDWDADPALETTTILGFHTPPIIHALWHSLTTTQPGGFLMRKIHCAQAVFADFRDLWNDFCSWSSHRRFIELDPQPTAFSEEDHRLWRGPRAAQYQIGYQDPSADPKWRMKQIIEVKDYRDVNRVFHVASSNLTWTWKNRSFGPANWKFHVLRAPDGNHRRKVDEPPW